MKAMIASLALVLVATTSGCAGRQVEVTTGPEPAADVSIRFTNNLTQAVNLYVASGGTDVFLKQVSSNSVENVPVRGLQRVPQLPLRRGRWMERAPTRATTSPSPPTMNGEFREATPVAGAWGVLAISAVSG